MTLKSITIGQLARCAGVHVETIRYYQRIGLIIEPRKPNQGYRLYPPATLDRVRFIKRAQELGFTLKEIENLLSLSDGNCADIQSLAEHKLNDIKAKITDLNRLVQVLEDLILQCRTNPDKASCPIIQTLQPPEK